MARQGAHDDRRQTALVDGWSIQILRVTFYPHNDEIGTVVARRRIWPLSALEQLAEVSH